MNVFPATDLKPFAEPVSADGMKIGRVYFALQFLDESMLVPTLQPMLFLGNLDADNPALRIFQDFDSYLAGVRYEPKGDENSSCFEAHESHEGKHIFEYEKALQALMTCALTRRQTPDVDNEITSQLG